MQGHRVHPCHHAATHTDRGVLIGQPPVSALVKGVMEGRQRHKQREREKVSVRESKRERNRQKVRVRESERKRERERKRESKQCSQLLLVCLPSVPLHNSSHGSIQRALCKHRVLAYKCVHVCETVFMCVCVCVCV